MRSTASSSHHADVVDPEPLELQQEPRHTGGVDVDGEDARARVRLRHLHRGVTEPEADLEGHGPAAEQRVDVERPVWDAVLRQQAGDRVDLRGAHPPTARVEGSDLLHDPMRVVSRGGTRRPQDLPTRQGRRPGRVRVLAWPSRRSSPAVMSRPPTARPGEGRRA